MALKKSQLYSSIWQACDALRGGMDASQYKDYVLSLLFVRYVTDRYGKQENSEVVIPEGGSFTDLSLLKGKPNIGEGVNKVLSKLAEANNLRGVIDSVDFNDESKLGSGKEMQDRLTDLIGIFEKKELDFSKNGSEGDDLLGDAYEYLMKHFAVQSGKSKGQFYTPAEVSKIIAKVIGANKAESRRNTVYDPTCGSGSLLLKIAAETPHGITINGQELDSATAALAIMNMWLHGQPDSDIRKGKSTLSSPLFVERDGSLKKFEYIVANPPFSYKSWSNGFNPEQDQFERFAGFGIPPAKNGDYAFLLHIIKSLKSTGQGAVVLPHGVLFRGNAEAEIRANLIKRSYIKGIVGLPANLFYGTGIPACIIVIDKENASTREGIFMIDASKGFVKDGNKNRLREQDIHRIVDVFTKQLEVAKFSRFVPTKEIEEKEYNLNLQRYIDSQEEEDLQNIEAHLQGSIPNADLDALSKYWQVCPNLQKDLFNPAERWGFSDLTIGEDEIKKTIYDHPEFIGFGKRVQTVFDTWKSNHIATLKQISSDTKPKELIASLSEDLLTAFEEVRLIDNYDVYQHLMTYWNEIMQDDAYLIVSNGWHADVTPIKNKKGKQTGWESALLPKELVINRYFKDDKSSLEELNSQLDKVSAQMEELSEEHSGDEGLLEDAKTEAGNLSKASINARLKDRSNPPDGDEVKVLKQYLQLLNKEADVKKSIKNLEANLDHKLFKKYQQLSKDEVRQLVVDDKWLTTLEELVQSELDRVSQKLTSRIKELATRYKSTLPQLDKEVSELTRKVEGHLQKMGFTW
ncbi:MAG: type I restriction-modification system subunit M [Candidatus Pacebacteria bacterium CG10_big_fil_rev_8_21_14_0_10_42_12]|nr:MAG: type I restriction-modification system subunit M [Candidatus Pacebacteria bacterium CG10_big_fil_rev_8_21_14_0_10_42_12]